MMLVSMKSSVYSTSLKVVYPGLNTNETLHLGFADEKRPLPVVMCFCTKERTLIHLPFLDTTAGMQGICGPSILSIYKFQSIKKKLIL